MAKPPLWIILTYIIEYLETEERQSLTCPLYGDYLKKVAMKRNCSMTKGFPEKSSYRRNEQVYQGVKCKAPWALQWTG